MRFSFFSLLQRLALASLLGLAASAAAQAQHVGGRDVVRHRAGAA